MKQIITNYTFTKGVANAGTVRLTDFSIIRKDRIYLIVNVNTGTIIYQFNNSTLGGSVATNVLTLATDTSAMSNSDPLMVIYDCMTGDPTYDKTPVSLADLIFGEDSLNNLTATLMKPASGSQYAPLTYRQFHSVTTANVKPAAGNVYSVSVTNENSSPRWFQLFNTATVPSNGNSPQISWELVPGTASSPFTRVISSDELAPSEYFTSGIAFGISTLEGTYSPATATDHGCIVRYL